jgi:hypothetical protein
MDPTNTNTNTNKNKDRDVEQWLDAALSQYGNVEPRTGLDSRVLANLQAERNRLASRQRWWWAVGAVAAAVAIAAVVGIGENSRRRNPERVAETSMPTHHEEARRSIEPAPVPVPQAARSAKEVAQQRPANQPSHELAVAATPKLDQFPSRRSLSGEELLLVRRLNEPSGKEALLGAGATRAEGDLSIDSLEIRPLQIPDIESSESKTN